MNRTDRTIDYYHPHKPHNRTDGSECPYMAEKACNNCGWVDPAAFPEPDWKSRAEALDGRLTQAYAVLDAIDVVLDGEGISEFMESFNTVSRVVELRSRAEAAEKERDEFRQTATANAVMMDALTARVRELEEHSERLRKQNLNDRREWANGLKARIAELEDLIEHHGIRRAFESEKVEREELQKRIAELDGALRHYRHINGLMFQPSEDWGAADTEWWVNWMADIERALKGTGDES